MSKKNIKTIIVIIIILIITFLTFITINFNFKEKIVNDKDYLYEKVEQYLINQEQPKYLLENKDSKQELNVRDFKVFTDFAKLGIRESKDEIHVYVWALVESYYVQDGNLINNSGSSMPYKFIFKNDEIIDYETPVDGEDNKKSMEKIFPADLQNKLNSSSVDTNKIKNEVEEHYSYLDASIVATHMMLEATNIGIDNIWIEMFDKEKLKKEFNLNNGIEPVCLIPLGYASDDYEGNPLHNKRKDLKETVKFV